MASQLAFPLARKLVRWMIPFGKESTERVGTPTESQIRKFVDAPSVVFEDSKTHSMIAIGSAYNAATMKPDDFTFVINCCPSELSITHPHLVTVDLRDTNDITLNHEELDDILEDMRKVMKTPDSRVLISCWMGASRSVAVACYLCCRMYGPTMVGPRDWDFFYEEFKRHRPSINVSCQLKNQVVALLGTRSKKAE